VTEHGGKIYATSEIGRGATFVVELPLTKEPWVKCGSQNRIILKDKEF
jgi:signal transduction histidine kinase